MLTERTALPRTCASLRGFSRAFGCSARDGRVIERASVIASLAPAIPFRSMFNSAAYLDGGGLTGVLPTLAGDCESSGITAWAVWAHESDLAAGAALREAGLRIDSRPTAVCAELDKLDLDAGDPVRVGVEVKVADDLEEFDRVQVAAYEGPPWVRPYCFPRLRQEFGGYVLRAGGSAVCALATVQVDDDCGVTLVGTAPDARRPGRGVTADVRRARVGPGSRMPEHHAPSHLDGGLALRPPRVLGVRSHEPVAAVRRYGAHRGVRSRSSGEYS